MRRAALAVLAGAALLPAPAGAVPPSDADPFVGTAGDGGTFPGPAVPFGLASPSPDTCETAGSGFCPGRPASGFSQVHASGTGGAPRYGTFRLMPDVGTPALPGRPGPLTAQRAAPGRYAARLADRGVDVALTATRLTTHTRLAFPRTRDAQVALDVAARLGHPSAQGQRVRLARVRLVGRDGFAGTVRLSGGWGLGGLELHVAGRFSRAPRALALHDARGRRPGRAAVSRADAPLGLVATFDARERRRVDVTMALSFVSQARAARTLRAAPSFDRALARARAAWRAALGRVRVRGGTRAQRRVLATALYHAHLMPRDLGPGENAWWRSREPHVEDLFTLWDVHRTQLPLLAVLQPAMAAKVARSLVDTWRHTGWLPDARIAGSSGITQVGSSAPVVLADALARGVPGLDRRALWAAVRRDAFVPSPSPVRHGRELRDYVRLGFLPAGARASVSRTLEYATADAAAARVAQAAGDRAAARTLRRRAASWRALWDPATRTVQPRDAAGALVPVDPDRRFQGFLDPFYEGTARQWSTAVPQDVPGLIARTGGPEGFGAWLDAALARDDAGNEPSFLAPWLHLHAGRHDRTVEAVRRRLATAYGDGPAGLPGNDDAGALSAWAAWSSVGLFPHAGEPLVLLGSPLFDRVVLALPGGRHLDVRAPGAGTRPYVTGARLRGRELRRAWLTHRELVRGGVLELRMSGTPSRFGQGVPPPVPRVP